MKRICAFLVLTVCLLVFANGTAPAKEAAKSANKALFKAPEEQAASGEKDSSKDIGKTFLGEEAVKVPATGEKSPSKEKEAPSLQRKKSSSAQPVQQGPLHSYFIPPLGPYYHYVTPFSGLDRGWVEMANIGEEGANVVVIIYNRAGEMQAGNSRRIPPHGYASTREMFGDRDIPAIADPAVVGVKSSGPLCVTSCRFEHSSQAWGFDVWPTRMLDANFTTIPVKGFGNAKLEFANPTGFDLNLEVILFDAGGVRLGSATTTLPPHGYASTLDADLFGGNLYDRGNPLLVHVAAQDVESDEYRKVAINLVRWAESRGWGLAPTSIRAVGTDGATSPFPDDWPNGWLEATFVNRTGLTDIYNPVRVEVWNGAGTSVGAAQTDVDTLYAYVNSFDVLGGQIPDFASPGAAEIAAVKPAGVAITNLLIAPCAGTWSSASGCAYPVHSDELAGSEYEFPVNGFSNASVEITNIGEGTATVRLEVYPETGGFSYGTTVLDPRASVSDDNPVWRSTLGGDPYAMDIYGYAKPCVVNVTSMGGGRIRVAHTRSSDWGAAGYAPLPTYILQVPEEVKLEVGDPVGTGFMGEIEGDD